MELQKAIRILRIKHRSSTRVRLLGCVLLGVIWIRIGDPRSLRSWYILVTDSSLFLWCIMIQEHDLRSLILIQITRRVMIMTTLCLISESFSGTFGFWSVGYVCKTFWSLSDLYPILNLVTDWLVELRPWTSKPERLAGLSVWGKRKQHNVAKNKTVVKTHCWAQCLLYAFPLLDRERHKVAKAESLSAYSPTTPRSFHRRAPSAHEILWLESGDFGWKWWTLWLM